jgi:glutamine synthetase
MTVLNIVVADSIDKMLELIKKYQKTEKSFEVAVLRSIKDVLARTRDIRFEKDGYSKEWQREAKKRGLYTNNRLLTALGELVVDKNINLFAKYDILTEVELRSRFSAWSNLYNTNKMIEINVLLEMLENSVIPDIIAYRTFIINSLKDTKGVLEAALVRGERNLLKEYAELISKLFTKKDELVAYKKIFKNKEELSGINYVYENINPIIADIKDILDKLEKRTGEKYWSLLKYKDLLFF